MISCLVVYFGIATNIWSVFFDKIIFEYAASEIPRRELKRREILFPTLQQVLWAIGFMNCELAGVIGERPIKFLHKPFRDNECLSSGSEAWRQIYIRRGEKVYYSLETVCVTDYPQGALLAYVFPFCA